MYRGALSYVPNLDPTAVSAPIHSHPTPHTRNSHSLPHFPLSSLRKWKNTRSQSSIHYNQSRCNLSPTYKQSHTPTHLHCLSCRRWRPESTPATMTVPLTRPKLISSHKQTSKHSSSLPCVDCQTWPKKGSTASSARCCCQRSKVQQHNTPAVFASLS